MLAEDFFQMELLEEYCPGEVSTRHFLFKVQAPHGRTVRIGSMRILRPVAGRVWFTQRRAEHHLFNTSNSSFGLFGNDDDLK
jgi:hypothetical protein